MNLITFISEHLPSTYTIKINQELSYRFDKSMDNVVLKIQHGTRYQRGVIMPLSILITSKDTMNALSVWNTWVLEVSDRDYLEGTTNYYMIYQTPVVSQVFDEVSNNYYSVISIFGTIVETNGVLDIKKLEVDGVEIIINDGTFQLSNTPNSEQPSDNGFLNKANIINSVLSLNVTTFIDDYGTLGAKLKNMRKGTVDPDTPFTVTITWTDESTETNQMRCTSQSFQKNRGQLSTLTLNFTL